MAKIKIDGISYKVNSRLGYVHDIDGYVAEVQTKDGPRKCVKRRSGNWAWWTAEDRIAPLRQAIAMGQWPKQS